MAGNNNSGRKAKPDAIHYLNGNPSKKPLGQVGDLGSGNVPFHEVNTMPECPDFLDDVAKKKWLQLAPDLHAIGLLTRLEGDALAEYCQHYSTWVKATKKIEQQGEIVESPNGYPQMSPWVSIRKGALADMKAIQANFGMNPAARSKSLRAASVQTQPSLFENEVETAEERLSNAFGLH